MWGDTLYFVNRFGIPFKCDELSRLVAKDTICIEEMVEDKRCRISRRYEFRIGEEMRKTYIVAEKDIIVDVSLVRDPPQYMRVV